MLRLVQENNITTQNTFRNFFGVRGENYDDTFDCLHEQEQVYDTNKN